MRESSSKIKGEDFQLGGLYIRFVQLPNDSSAMCANLKYIFRVFSVFCRSTKNVFNWMGRPAQLHMTVQRNIVPFREERK